MNEFVTESESDAAAGPAMDPRRTLILPLWRGRWLIVSLTLLGVVGGVFLGLMRPNTYRSFGKLMIRAGMREELTPEMSLTGSGVSGMGGRSAVNNEMHLLNSPQVFEEAARAVTPAVIFQPYDPGAHDDETTPGMLALFHRWQSWWFQSTTSDDSLAVKHAIDGCDLCVRAASLVLQKNLSILPEPGSDVITITYAAHDPLLAQKVVAAFVEAAIAHHRKIYETNTTLEILNSRLTSANSDVALAESDFVNFKTECGVYDFENQQRTLTTSIETLETLCNSDRASLEEMRARKEELEPRVAEQPEMLEERTESPLQPNPQRALWLQQLVTLENSLADLEARQGLTTDQRREQVESLQKRINEAHAELDKQPEFVGPAPMIQRRPNPRRIALQQQLDDLTLDLHSLEAAATVRSGQLEELRKRMQKMTECEPRFNALGKVADLARSDYAKLLSKRGEASLMGSLDQLEISNLRCVQEATLPSEKEGPLRGKLLLIGVLLGAVAGCGLAFARNLLDGRLHDATEVEQVLGTRVLGVLPKARPASKAGVTRRAAL